MDSESLDTILDEIFPNFEPLDAQSAALLQLLKAKGLVTDEEFAPFLEQAANAASVRWLAVRVRVEAMIANLINPPEEFSAAPTGKADQASENDPSEHREENSTAEQETEQRVESEPESTNDKPGSYPGKKNESAGNDVERAA
jgi:hypothetical protein